MSISIYIHVQGHLEQWDLTNKACPRCGQKALFLRNYGGSFWSPDEEFQCGKCEYASNQDAGSPERRNALMSNGE